MASYVGFSVEKVEMALRLYYAQSENKLDDTACLIETHKISRRLIEKGNLAY